MDLDGTPGGRALHGLGRRRGAINVTARMDLVGGTSQYAREASGSLVRVFGRLAAVLR